MDINTLITFFLLIIGVVLVARSLPAKSDQPPTLLDKMATASQKKQKGFSPNAGLNVIGSFNLLWLKIFPKLYDFYRRRLTMADMDILPEGLFFIKEAMAVFSVVVAVQFFKAAPPILFTLVIISMFAPDFFLKSRIENRHYLIMRTFPEIIDLMSLCLSAGLDFMSSLRWLTEGKFLIDSPFIIELKKLKEEIVLGKSRVQALKDLDKRVEMPEVSSLVRTLVIAENMGVSVSEALARFSIDIRERRFHSGERQARMASLKILVPLIFFILPVVGIIIIGPIFIKFTSEGFMQGF